MFKESLNLKMLDGSLREIPASDLLSIQPYIEIIPIRPEPGIFFAGPLEEVFVVKTKDGELKVPRFPENDREVLDFIFSNADIRRKSML
jgi:hypothetical protein